MADDELGHLPRDSKLAKTRARDHRINIWVAHAATMLRCNASHIGSMTPLHTCWHTCLVMGRPHPAYASELRFAQRHMDGFFARYCANVETCLPQTPSSTLPTGSRSPLAPGNRRHPSAR